MVLVKRVLIASSLCAAAALVGCGSSGGGAPSDGCSGHTTCNGGPALTDPEGGQIFLEYIYVDSDLATAFGLPQGVTTIQRAIGFFMDNETPEDNPLPTFGQCNNLVTTMGWPWWIGSPHTDLDVGTLTISGKNDAGTAVNISVPNQGAGTDGIGRAHDIYYQVINPDAGQYVSGNQPYTVAFGGSGAIPATTFDQEAPNGDTDGMFLPAHFDVGTPAVEDDGPMIAGTDYPVTWTLATSSNLPAGDDVTNIVLLLDTNGVPTHLCPNDSTVSSFTIPGSVLNEYKQIATARGADPTHILLSRQQLVHHIARLPNGEANNQRRLDFMSVFCWVQMMDLQ